MPSFQGVPDLAWLDFPLSVFGGTSSVLGLIAASWASHYSLELTAKSRRFQGRASLTSRCFTQGPRSVSSSLMAPPSQGGSLPSGPCNLPSLHSSAKSYFCHLWPFPCGTPSSVSLFIMPL